MDHIYFVVSTNTRKVLAVKDSSINPGAQVVMETLRPELTLNQLWYQDMSGSLVSVLSSYAISTETPGGKRLTLSVRYNDSALGICAASLLRYYC